MPEDFIPRVRYGMIQPQAPARGVGFMYYQFYRIVPLDVIELSAVLGITDYTEQAVELALDNYWKCVDALAKEKVQVIILGGAPVSAALGRRRTLELLRETTERTGIPADATLEALIASMKQLDLSRLCIGSRWADPVNDSMVQYLRDGGIDVVGITRRNQWGAQASAMSLDEGLNMALEVGREAARAFPQAEAISVPGGVALALHVIPTLEQEFGKPAFTNMSNEVWNNLIRPGLIKPVTGWGRLLASSPQ